MTTPTTQREADERKLFEADLRAEAHDAGGSDDIDLHVAQMLQRAPNGDYATSWVHSRWEGWQRALVGRTSAASPLPRALGVTRDAESPGGKGILVFFERPLDDDELRAFHDSFSGAAIDQSTRQAAPEAPTLIQARRDDTPSWFTLAASDVDEYERDGYEIRRLYASPLSVPEAPTAATDQPSAGQVDERAEVPGTYMTPDQAFKWAWNTLKKDLGAERWNVGDEVQSWAFFKYGWDYKTQYEKQARASLTPTAPQAASQQAEPIYQVQYQGTAGTSLWHDATEAAYHTFMPKRRRIVYAAPQAATTASASGLIACANCLRPKCEHNGKLCPAPFTTHWNAWDYAQPQPIYPEYDRAQAPSQSAPEPLNKGTREQQLEAVARAGCDEMIRIHAALGFSEDETIDAEKMIERIAALARAPLPAQEPIGEVWQCRVNDDWNADFYDYEKLTPGAKLYLAAPVQAVDVARDAERLDLLLNISGFHFVIINQKEHLLDARGRIAGVGATKREAIDAAMSRTNTTGGSDE